MQPSIPKKLTIQLGKTKFDKAKGDRPLGEVMAEAVNVVNSCGIDHRYISRHAIRAVCEEIIRRGQVALPIEVDFKYTAPSLPGTGLALCGAIAASTEESDDNEEESWLQEQPRWKNSDEVEPLPLPQGFGDTAESVGLTADRLAYLLCYAAQRYPLLARFVLRFNQAAD
jgi:hypothetical protein